MIKELVVGGIPEFDEIVVAASGEAISAGADGSARANLGSLDHANWFRLLGRRGPGDKAPS